MPGKSSRILITACLVFYIALLLYWYAGLSAEKVEVTIPKGVSAHEAVKILRENHIVSFPKLFLQFVKITGNTKNIKAGTYEFSQRDSIFKIIKMLKQGRAVYIKVTIPEGFDSRQIAERLAQKGIADKDEFLKIVEDNKLEGYLFPETYYFEQGSGAKTVADKMAEEFNKNFTPEMRERANSMRRAINEKKIITLASIIEKEAMVPEERPVISAVFHNRLKKRMYLESCATILFALGKHKEKLTYDDLDVESPYNTYRHFGLPPGPICSPGLASINAALYPADTDSLFFVVKGSGTHTFSTRYDEHLKKKRIRKKKLRQQKEKKN
jgi:UPF0755 protein